MKILKYDLTRDDCCNKDIIRVDISTLDNNDDPVVIKLTVVISEFEIHSVVISPSFYGIKYTRQQVLGIIKNLFPVECKNITVAIDHVSKRIKKQFPSEDVIQDLVRRNIDLVIANLLLGVKKGRLFSASFADEQALSTEIIKLFEEYKNLS